MQGINFVLMAASCGMCAAAAWDLMSAFRKSWGIEGFAAAVIDFLSPAAFAALVWLGVLYILDGSTRVYGFLCIGAGVVLYIFTVREWVFKLFYTVFGNIKKIIGFIFKILLTPTRFLYKMLYVELYTKRRRVSAETGKTLNDPKN